MVDYQWFSDKDIFAARDMAYVPAVQVSIDPNSNQDGCRSISVDKTHLTIAVQGTFGYLDPEYFQSSQFTEKSNIYIVKGAGKEEILAVVHVAKRCLSLNGRKRPTLKEIVMELDAIRMSDAASAACEDVEFAADDDLTGQSGPWEAASTSTGSFYSTV
ncbi:hypothetical protein RHSIM_Rhsim04G0078800 [Rhododendron simsii]|uniref:Uncharacterized protein n=1 Tax=Rhododendron simsii TaxID=118357 RepID=A0A834HEM4_RHOSS|nr:hypothetical protein RHSIM_Rhsim04G0078800 [Rhododendron simsii]